MHGRDKFSYIEVKVDMVKYKSTPRHRICLNIQSFVFQNSIAWVWRTRDGTCCFLTYIQSVSILYIKALYIYESDAQNYINVAKEFLLDLL